LFDDADTTVAKPAWGAPTWSSLVMSIINNAPFQMEKADVSEKGKHFALFRVVGYTTNFTNARLHDVSLYAAPFWRRFPVRIDVTLKNEFSPGKDGKGMVDYSTIPPGVDPLLYTLSRYDPNSQDQERPYKQVAVFTTRTALCQQLLSEETLHYERQVKIVERLRSHGPTCPTCYMDLEAHEKGDFCPVETMQMMNLDAPIVDVDAPSVIKYLTVTRRDLLTVGVLFFFALIFLWLYPPISIPLFAIGLSQCNFGLSSMLYHMFVIVMSTPFSFLKAGYDLGSTIKKEATKMQQEFDIAIQKVFPKLNLIKILIGLLLALIGRKVVRAFEAENPRLQGVDGSLTQVDDVKKKFYESNEKWIQTSTVARPFGLIKDTTYSFKDYAEALQQRLIKIQTKYGFVKGVRLEDGLVITVKHAFFHTPKGDFFNPSSKLEYDDYPVSFISIGGARVEIPFCKERFWPVPDRDMVVIYAPQIFPLKQKGMLLRDKVSQTYQANTPGFTTDEAFLVTEDKLVTCKSLKATKSFGSRVVSRAVWKGDFPDTENSWCGYPVIARVGPEFCMVGIHFGLIEWENPILMTKSFNTYAEDFSMLEIQRIYEENITALEIPIVREMTVQLQMFGVEKVESFKRKSSIMEAISQSATFRPALIGTAHLHVQNPKTKFVETAYRHDFANFEREVTGDYPYWEPPDFSGSEEDGVWNDPFVRFWKDGVNTCADLKLWVKARDDYLDGADLLFGKGLRPLSDHEAISGVDGTRIGPQNFNTSAGPPRRKAKKAFVVKIDSEVSFMTKDIQSEMDFIMNEIRSGGCVSGFSDHPLKDEVLSSQKNLLRKVRVFNSFPLAFNILMKKYGAPVMDFMRQHWEFFESAIGIDITSSSSADMISFIQRKGDLVGYHASDFKHFDASAGTDELLFACDTFRRLCLIIGYTDEEAWISYWLSMGFIYTIRCVKGDLFLLSYLFSTGSWITMLFNTIRNSLINRYCYFRSPLSTRPFRVVVSRLGLGDDNIGGVSKLIPWFTQQYFAEGCACIGHELTSSTKGDLHDWETLATATFLKRSFVFRDGLWFVPIEKKSLSRMAAYRDSKSALSAYDTAAVTGSNMIVEAFFHGEAFYDWMLEQWKCVAHKYGYSGERWKVYSYATLLAKWRDNSLSCWDPEENGPRELLIEPDDVNLKTVETISYQMNTSSVVNELVVSAVENTLGSLQVKAPLEMVTSKSSPDIKSFPNDTPQSFFKRQVLLARYSFSGATVYGSLLTGAYVDPYQLYFTNALVVKRISGYYSFTGTLKLTFQMFIPGSCLGALIVGILPQTLTTPLYDAVDDVGSMFQMKHAILDASMASSATIEVPFHSLFEYYNLRSPPPCWKVVIGVIAPICSTIGGSTSGQLLMYGSLGDDVVFGIPTLQMEPEHASAIKHALPPLNSLDIQPITVGTTLKASNEVELSVAEASSAESPTSFSELVRKETVVSYSVIQTSDVVGAELDSIYVNPLETCANSRISVPGWLCYPFEFWKGTLVYKVHVFSSMNVKGVLEVFWTPDATSYTGVDVTNRLLNTKIDLTGSSCTTIRVPFMAPSAGLAVEKHFTYNQPWYNGLLVFRVYSPLQTPLSGVSIYFVTTLSAEDDFQFANPRSWASNVSGTKEPWCEKVTYQMEGGVACVENDGEFPMVIPLDTGKKLWGEDVRDISDLVRKFSNIVVDTGGFQSLVFTPPSTYTVYNTYKSNSSNHRTSMTFFGFYSGAYDAMMGSTEWLIDYGIVSASGPSVNFNSSCFYNDIYQTLSGFNTLWSPTMHYTTNVALDNWGVYRAAAKYQYKLVPRLWWSVTGTFATTLFPMVGLSTLNTTTYSANMRAGTDFKLVAWRRTPRIAVADW